MSGVPGSFDPFSLFGGIGGGGLPGLPGLPYGGQPNLPGQVAVGGSPWDPVSVTPAPTGDVRNLNQPQGPQGPAGQSKVNALIAALRGASAPPKPDVVKPTTPAAPQMHQLKAGALFDLLNQVSNPRATPRPLTTLGGALGIGRY